MIAERKLKGAPEIIKSPKDMVLGMLYEFLSIEETEKGKLLKGIDIPTNVLIGEIEDETVFGKQILLTISEMLNDEMMFRQAHGNITSPEVTTQDV